MESHLLVSPCHTDLLAAVINESRKTFINPKDNEINARRASVKKDIQSAVVQEYGKSFTQSQFNEVFAKLTMVDSFNHNPLLKSLKEIHQHEYHLILNEIFDARLTDEMLENIKRVMTFKYNATRFDEIDEHANSFICDEAWPELVKSWKVDQFKLLPAELVAVEREKIIAAYKDYGQSYDAPEEDSHLWDACLFADYLLKFKSDLYQVTVDEIKKESLHLSKSVKTIRPHACFYLYADDDFKTYDANRLENSNFVAMAGPSREEGLAEFLDNILLANENPLKPKITQIIGLGNCLPLINPRHFHLSDFINYFFQQTDTAEKSLQIKVQDAKYDIQFENTHVSPSYHVSAQQELPKGFATSIIHITKSTNDTKVAMKLDTLLLAIPDGDCLSLEGDGDDTTKIKEALWQVVKNSVDSSVAVHCRGGVGRTGYIILLLELVKNYQHVFAGQDPQLINARIQKTIEIIRANRPPLIAGFNQCEGAIRGAHILYQYALEKNYLRKADKMSEFSIFKPKRLTTDEKTLLLACGSRGKQC